MNSFFVAHKKSILFGALGVILGAIGGFIYWKYVGCINGTCTIWSSPTRSTAYGALMGGLFLLAFVPDNKKNQNL